MFLSVHNSLLHNKNWLQISFQVKFKEFILIFKSGIQSLHYIGVN